MGSIVKHCRSSTCYVVWPPQGVSLDHLKLETVLVSGEGSEAPQAKICEFGYSTWVRLRCIMALLHQRPSRDADCSARV